MCWLYAAFYKFCSQRSPAVIMSRKFGNFHTRPQQNNNNRTLKYTSACRIRYLKSVSVFNKLSAVNFFLLTLQIQALNMDVSVI